MNMIKATAASLLLVGSVAFANDTANKAEHTTDVSKNPITGTVTKTDEVKKEIKNADGSKGELKIKKKTKEYKDGTVKHSTDATSDTKEVHH